MNTERDRDRHDDEDELVFLETRRSWGGGSDRVCVSEICDPDGMIRSALAGLGNDETSAEDIFVAWILALPPRLDAAAAARRLLGAYLPGRHRPASELGRRVARLLEEAARGVPGDSPRRGPARPSRRRRALRGL